MHDSVPYTAVPRIRHNSGDGAECAGRRESQLAESTTKRVLLRVHTRNTQIILEINRGMRGICYPFRVWRVLPLAGRIPSFSNVNHPWRSANWLLAPLSRSCLARESRVIIEEEEPRFVSPGIRNSGELNNPLQHASALIRIFINIEYRKEREREEIVYVSTMNTLLHINK